MTGIKAQLQQMVLAFKEINPNAKKILFFEPIFAIPYAMFIIYSSLYMTRVGVKDYQIGLLSTVLNLIMLITSPFAGMLVNRFGRKKGSARWRFSVVVHVCIYIFLCQGLCMVFNCNHLQWTYENS